MHSKVFDGLKNPTINSTYCLINAYVKCGKPHYALALYRNKLKHIVCQEEAKYVQKEANYDQNESKYCPIYPNPRTFVALFKACGKVKDLEIGVELYAEAARMGWIETDCFIGCSLVDMFAKCGKVVNAQEVFDKLAMRDVVSWNAIITGHVQNGFTSEALKFFFRMESEGALADEVTYIRTNAFPRMTFFSNKPCSLTLASIV